MEYQFEKLRQFADKAQFHISEKQLNQFQTFCGFLNEKNEVMNLTAITDPEEVETKHFMDSVAGAPVIRELWKKQICRETQNTPNENPHFRLIDVGTGAGFPGIPLKILFPEDNFTFMDSLNKRIHFIMETADLLEFHDYYAIAGRAEDLAKKGESYREAFDFCTSRAVAELPVLLEYCLPFVKTGGYCILYKSVKYETEVETSGKALQELGGVIEEIRDVSIPGSDQKRFLVIVKKIASTPEKYPRRAGKPTKSPLL